MSRGEDLNPQPIAYEAIALPLSYPGISFMLNKNIPVLYGHAFLVYETRPRWQLPNYEDEPHS